MNENDYLKVRAENMEREVGLLRRQVSGLQEDNERINRMYQVVEREAVFTSSSKLGHDNLSSNFRMSENAENKVTIRADG